MTITFSQTARDVVVGAMQDLGVIALGETPDADELQYGIDHLDMILKELAAEGASPWSDMDGSVVFGVGIREVMLVPRPAQVSDASIVYPTFQRQLFQWSSGEYEAIPNKAQPGVPVRYDLRLKPDGVYMRVWPVPDVATTVDYSYTRVLEDVEATTPLDLPQMWSGAIRKMLKARLTVFQPDGMPAQVLAEAEIAKNQLLDYARPEQYILGAQC